MSLGEHLVEFRNRLIISAVAILIALVAGWLLAPWVWSSLREPIEALKINGRSAVIQHTDITSGFDTTVQIALFIAILLASPVWLYQIWAFIMPGLKRKEKLYAVGFLGAAVPLFLAGIYAGWSVLPNIVRVMAFFSPNQDDFNLTARSYIDMAIKLCLAVGVGFVLPVLLVLLNFIGILRGTSILKAWRGAILAIVLFAAITTPSTDIMSMFLLALPIILLYFIAAGVAIWHDRIIDKRQAAEFAEYGLDDADEEGTKGQA